MRAEATAPAAPKDSPAKLSGNMSTTPRQTAYNHPIWTMNQAPTKSGTHEPAPPRESEPQPQPHMSAEPSENQVAPEEDTFGPQRPLHNVQTAAPGDGNLTQEPPSSGTPSLLKMPSPEIELIDDSHERADMPLVNTNNQA